YLPRWYSLRRGSVRGVVGTDRCGWTARLSCDFTIECGTGDARGEDQGEILAGRVVPVHPLCCAKRHPVCDLPVLAHDPERLFEHRSLGHGVAPEDPGWSCQLRIPA